MDARKAKRPEVRNAGASTGTITLASAFGYEQPSVRAASISVKSKSDKLASTVRVTYGSVITICPIRRLAKASRTPTCRSACSIATPTTRPGIMSGETMNVVSATLPGNVPRAIAIAHSVPRTSATTVDSSAISSESRTDGHSSRDCATRWYQRMESAGGGRLKTEEALTDTASVTASGASRVSTTRAVTAHITIVAA